MEPVSALASVAWLIGSLVAILRTLQHLTYRFLPKKLGVSYAHAEILLTNMCQQLAQFQSSLHADINHARVEELLYMLQSIEQDLDGLQEIIRNVNQYRRTRWVGRFPQRRDTEAVMTSILLAKNVIHIIMTLQELGHSDNMFIERVG